MYSQKDAESKFSNSYLSIDNNKNEDPKLKDPDNGDFTLQPDVEITGKDGTATFPSPPDRLSTDVMTVATVPDGTTIILGGLESINQSKFNSKVPILGDLPIIGGLFRGIDNTGDQGRLYVFVKANISTIPIPAAIWLFSSGLLGLIGVARRKKA